MPDTKQWRYVAVLTIRLPRRAATRAIDKRLSLEQLLACLRVCNVAKYCATWAFAAELRRPFAIFDIKRLRIFARKAMLKGLSCINPCERCIQKQIGKAVRNSTVGDKENPNDNNLSSGRASHKTYYSLLACRRLIQHCHSYSWPAI